MLPLCNLKGPLADKKVTGGLCTPRLKTPPHCQWRRCMLDLFLSLIHSHPQIVPSTWFCSCDWGEMLGVSSSPGNENYRRQEQGVNGSKRRSQWKQVEIFCVAISCSCEWSQKWQGEKVTWVRGKLSAFSLSVLRLPSPNLAFGASEHQWAPTSAHFVSGAQ